MRLVIGVVAMMLAGCVQTDEIAPVAIETETEPALNATVNVTLPPMIRLNIAGPDGPVDADVWVEPVNLTDPVNNIAAYQVARAAAVEAPGGVVELEPDGNLTRFAVRADGMVPWSGQVRTPEEGTLEVDVMVRPWPGATVTAHRGGALYAPDNSLSALHKAGLLGIPRAEIDVQWTSDEVFVLWHDGVIEDPAGTRVWMSTAAEVATWDVGSSYDESFAGEAPPTLDEALAVMAEYGTIPVVEVKLGDDPRRSVMMQAAMDALVDFPDAVVISFDPTYDVHCGAGGLSCGYIEAETEGVRPDALGIGKDAFAPFITEHHMPQTLATPDYIAASQAAGNLVTAWTVNDVDDALALVADGVDAITTDMPWEVMQALAG